MKKCFKCKLEKVLDDFYTQGSWCKQCRSEYAKQKNYSKLGKGKQVRDDLDNGNRICNKCKEEKSLDVFPKNKKCRGGRERTCKKCTYKGREKKEQKENQKKLRRKWYLENKNITLERQKKRYQENKERLQAYGRQHAKDNPEIYRAARHRRRMRKRSNGRNDLTADQIRWMFENFPYCVYCGNEDDLTVDHVVPISKGGENTLSNVVPACSDCNNKKRAKLIQHSSLPGCRLCYELASKIVLGTTTLDWDKLHISHGGS